MLTSLTLEIKSIQQVRQKSDKKASTIFSTTSFFSISAISSFPSSFSTSSLSKLVLSSHLSASLLCPLFLCFLISHLFSSPNHNQCPAHSLKSTGYQDDRSSKFNLLGILSNPPSSPFYSHFPCITASPFLLTL